MTTALVVGSGPAAAGAVLALCRREDLKITVLDVGVGLDDTHQRIVDDLASSEPDGWDGSMVAAISQQPVDSKKPGLPEKRTFGSDYPFRNVGQLDGLTASANTTASFVSAAYGRFQRRLGRSAHAIHGVGVSRAGL